MSGKISRVAERGLAFFLSVTLLFSCIRFPALGEGGSQTYLDGFKVQCVWSNLMNTYEWNAKAAETRQPKLIVTYRMENANKDYPPGTICFAIPGIGNANRATVLKASELAADEKDSEWEYEWDQTSDTYIFKNKFELKTGQSVNGGFELLWTLSSRSCSDGYSQERSPRFSLAGSGEIVMEPLIFKFTSERDRYRIQMSRERLSAAEYEKEDSEYVWYNVKTRFDKDWKARGLYRSSYYMTVELPEGVAVEDVRVKHSGREVELLEDADGKWGFYPFKGRSGDLGNQWNTYTSTCIAGFRKDALEGRNVTLHGHLDRIYEDEEEWITTAGENEKVDDSLTFTVEAYRFTYNGYIYSHEKEGPYSVAGNYEGRLNAANIYSGKLIPFTLYGSAKRNYADAQARRRENYGAAAARGDLENDSGGVTAGELESCGGGEEYNTLTASGSDAALFEDGPGAQKSFFALTRATASNVLARAISQITGEQEYSLVLGDDKLAIFLNDGSIRNLEDTEYNMDYVTLPKDDRDYDYEVYGAASQDTPFEEYGLLGNGNLKDGKTIKLPDGIKAVYVKVNGIRGSFYYSAQVGVRLNLDWEKEQEKEEAMRPDHENHLVNFSYLRSLYQNCEGEEKNDCALAVENYEGSYGKELADRDFALYGEQLMRDYSNVWLRNPETKLTADAVLKEFKGRRNAGFSAEAESSGVIKAESQGPLEKFSLYTVLPKGLKAELDTGNFLVLGSGNTQDGSHVENFGEYASLSADERDGKTVVTADFDFGKNPLECSESVTVKLQFPVSLSYSDFLDLGSQYTMDTFLMVHDEGVERVGGPAIMSDRYDMDRDGRFTEKMAYDSSIRVILEDTAEWREYVSKYVKSAYSEGYGTDTVTRLFTESDDSTLKEKSLYSYRLDFGLGSSNAKNLVFFDKIEQGARIAENGSGGNSYKDVGSEWKGTFVSVDTDYAESMGMIPEIYYSSAPDQEPELDAPGWSKEIPANPETVRAIAVSLDTKNMEEGLMRAGQATYITVNMRAPESRAFVGKLAVNQYEVQYDAYGLTSDFEGSFRLPSSETYIELMDTVGSIILQKVDSDSMRSFSSAGTRFQVYDSMGNPLFEEPREVDSLGRILIKNVPHGTYYYEETQASPGYQRLKGRHAFVVDGVTEVINIENSKIRGEATLIKRDKDDIGRAPLSGAVYELYTANGEQVFTDGELAYSESGTEGSFETGQGGAVTITNLPWGRYYFKEIEPPAGYELSDKQIPFSVGRAQYDEETERVECLVEAENEEKTASILLQKTDRISGKPVKGAVYSLFREKRGEETEDVLISSGHKTNAAGEIEVGGLKFGTYYFVETRNPGGYQMPKGKEAESEHAVLDAATAGQTFTISHTNERMKGIVTLIKKDDTGRLVGGAEYALWYKAALGETAGEYIMVGTYITDSKKDSETYGEISVGDLEWGTYYFVETRASEGYELSDEKIAFAIDKDSVQNPVFLETVDSRKKGSVRLTKVDKENPSLTLSGAVYDLYRTDGRKCILGQDYELPEGMTEIRTGPDGTVLIREIVQGGYYLQETKAPDSYSLNTTPVRFSVTKENCGTLQELTAEDEKGKAILTIRKRVNEVYGPFGSPTFLFKVSGGGKTYIKSITLVEGELTGSVSLSVEQGNVYTIEETEVSRYALESVIPGENVSVEDGTVRADLTAGGNAEVTFVNQMKQYEKFSHTGCVINLAKAKARFTGIQVEYTGPALITEDLPGYSREEESYTFPDSDLKVSAFYDDGTSVVVPAGEYILSPQKADGSQESYTGTVTVTKEGVTRTDSFQVALRLPAPAPKYNVTFELNGGTIVPTGGDSAQDRLFMQIAEGKTMEIPENDPVKDGYGFRGWYLDAALTDEAVFPMAVTEDATLYARWMEGAVKVRYAVSIYGIGQDTDENGNPVGLTMGPVTKYCYVDSYKNHSPSAGQMCMHDMTWAEIIAQSKKDPSVFRECLENSCTHSVELTICGRLSEGMESFPDMTGDGASTLIKTIAPEYRKWNRAQSTYYEEDEGEYKKGTNKGGWPDSAVRNTLNGTVTENMLTISNKDNGFAEAKLDEKEALISSFPSVLREAIVPKAVKSDTKCTNIKIYNVVSYDKLWLFSFKEAYKDDGRDNYELRPNEGVLYDRQDILNITSGNTSGNGTFDETGAETKRWQRSQKTYPFYVTCVYEGGKTDFDNPYFSHGLAPGFCLPGPQTDVE